MKLRNKADGEAIEHWCITPTFGKEGWGVTLRWDICICTSLHKSVTYKSLKEIMDNWEEVKDETTQ